MKNAPKMRTREEMKELFEKAKKVEMTPALEALAFIRVCLGCADGSLTSGTIEDDPMGLDIEGLVDDLNHLCAKLNREIAKLAPEVRIALDTEVDQTSDLVHRHSPTAR